MCGPASQQLSDWMQSHIPRDAAGALLRPAAMPAAACIELFSRLSALFMTPGSTQQLWQLTAAVAAHLSTDACASPSQARLAASTAAGAADALLTRSASGPAARLSTATSLGKLAASGLSSECRTSSIGGGSGGCSGTGCLCHLAKVRAGLVSAANQLELSVRGRGVGRACMGAAKREELLQQAALMHLEAGDAERCCELLVEVSRWMAVACTTAWEGCRQTLCCPVLCMHTSAFLSQAHVPHCVALCCACVQMHAVGLVGQGAVLGPGCVSHLLAAAHAACNRRHGKGRCSQQGAAALHAGGRSGHSRC